MLPINTAWFHLTEVLLWPCNKQDKISLVFLRKRAKLNLFSMLKKIPLIYPSSIILIERLLNFKRAMQCLYKVGLILRIILLFSPIIPNCILEFNYLVLLTLPAFPVLFRLFKISGSSNFCSSQRNLNMNTWNK